jgi:hypothetical protein
MPGLTDLPENEVADAASKEVDLLGNSSSGWGFGNDFRTLLYLAVMSSWQDEWTLNVGKKLRAVKPSVQVWRSSHGTIRTVYVTLAWHTNVC